MVGFIFTPYLSAEIEVERNDSIVNEIKLHAVIGSQMESVELKKPTEGVGEGGFCCVGLEVAY